MGALSKTKEDKTDKNIAKYIVLTVNVFAIIIAHLRIAVKSKVILKSFQLNLSFNDVPYNIFNLLIYAG